MTLLKSLLVFEALLVLACLLFVFVPCSYAASQSQAASALEDAEDAVVSAYTAISKADAAGANVSDLLVPLNEAGDLLTRARVAYGLGDYDSVLELSVLCQEKLNGFVAAADALTEVATRDSSMDFLVNVVGPIVGSVGIVCLGLVAWVYLNRRYGKTGGEV